MLQRNLRLGATVELEDLLLGTLAKSLEKKDPGLKDIYAVLEAGAPCFQDAVKTRWLDMVKQVLTQLQHALEETKHDGIEACSRRVVTELQSQAAVPEKALQEFVACFSEGVPLFNIKDRVNTALQEALAAVSDKIPDIVLAKPSLANDVSTTVMSMMEVLWPHWGHGEGKDDPKYRVASETWVWTELQTAVVELQAIGAEKLVEEDKDAKQAQGTVQKLVKANVTAQAWASSTVEPSVVHRFQDIMAGAEDSLVSIRNLYIQHISKQLESARAAGLPLCGGAPDGKSWKEGLSDQADITKVSKHAEKSLLDLSAAGKARSKKLTEAFKMMSEASRQCCCGGKTALANDRLPC